jgi:hypothetical protein
MPIWTSIKLSIFSTLHLSLLFISTGWDNVSELRQLTGLLLSPTWYISMGSDDGMILTGETEKRIQRKPAPVSACSSHPTKTDPGANPGRRDERSATNRLHPSLIFTNVPDFSKYKTKFFLTPHPYESSRIPCLHSQANVCFKSLISHVHNVTFTALLSKQYLPWPVNIRF